MIGGLGATTKLFASEALLQIYKEACDCIWQSASPLLGGWTYHGQHGHPPSSSPLGLFHRCFFPFSSIRCAVLITILVVGFSGFKLHDNSAIDTAIDFFQDFVTSPESYFGSIGVRARRAVEPEENPGFKIFAVPYKL